MHSVHLRRLKSHLRNAANRRLRQSSKAATAEREAGFTLLEMIVVIVIIGLLIGLVGPALLHQLGRARTSIAGQSIERLSSVLDMYKLDTGSYPSTDQGLQALISRPAGVSNWNGPYLKGAKLPVDPWGHHYIYRDPSNRAHLSYDLCSRGPNASITKLICNQ